jgi:hypothetical protein
MTSPLDRPDEKHSAFEAAEREWTIWRNFSLATGPLRNRERRSWSVSSRLRIGAENGTPLDPRQAIESASKP